MTLRTSLSLAIVLVVISLCGCANVKVQKVSVADRIQGKDHHVKGFRYYLTRPYVVVTRQVPVSTSYIPVAIGIYPRPAEPTKIQRLPPGTELVLVAQVPDAHGVFRVYDRKGHWLEHVHPYDVYILPANEITQNRRDPLTEQEKRTLAIKAQDVITNVVRDIAIQHAKNKMPAADHDRLRTALVAALTHDKFSDAFISAQDGRLIIQSGVRTAVAAARVFLNTNYRIKDFAPKENEIVTNVLRNVYAPIVEPPITPIPATQEPKIGSFVGTDPAAGPQFSTGVQAGHDEKVPTFQVAFLPDFEEQYAIHNVNCLAKTKYKYTFRNGTELTSISGTYNSTDVPVAIVETLGKLISAAGDIAKTRLKELPVPEPRAGLDQRTPQLVLYYLRIEHSIEPGMYRIQKSWERAAAADLAAMEGHQICGLFSEIGLPVVHSASVLTAAQYKKATGQ